MNALLYYVHLRRDEAELADDPGILDDNAWIELEVSSTFNGNTRTQNWVWPPRHEHNETVSDRQKGLA